MTLTDHEIDSQPKTWAAVLEHVDRWQELLRAPGERLLVLGCGTSAFMASSVAALRESAGWGETDWAYASEISTHRVYDRVVALSRSGTTSEVAAALTRARVSPTGRRVLVTAVPDSPLAALVDDVLLLDADEESVVQTRFPTTLLVAVRAALGENVAHLPSQCAAALGADPPFDLRDVGHVVYLGSGWTVGLAHEAALKVREAAQAWSESYPALDYRHGPIAVAGSRSLVWVLGPSPEGLVDDVAATGAVVVHEGSLPRPGGETLDPLVQLVLAQRVATGLAARQGLDPDHPRNLTRSVILPVSANGAHP